MIANLVLLLSLTLSEPTVDFSSKDLAGNDVRLSDFRGKVVLLNFWGIWCKSCRQEIPHLVALDRELREKGLVVLGADYGDDPKDLPAFVEELGMTYPVLVDDALADRFEVLVYPTSVVLDRSGRVRLRVEGFREESFEEMRSLVGKLVEEQASPPPGAGPDTVFLEELTWTEVRDRIASGTTTILLPTAGTEQNGPHMVLGKHRYIVRHTAEKIARRLGNALVAPVVDFVPEGGIDPPTGHMRFPGTVTLPNVYFMKICEYAARSFEAHGFTDIVFIGDSGGNQAGMKEVAAALNEEWRGGKTRVHFVPDYYSDNGYREWLVSLGETEETIGGHAGISDTSQLLFVAPEHIRKDRLAKGGGFEGSGVSGDPTRASVERGEKGIELKVEAAVAQIRKLMAER
jgi:creatinine amidohydrolase/Fe(II)-dependent formamide hydrolase-like protein/peroxiredoxin